MTRQVSRQFLSEYLSNLTLPENFSDTQYHALMRVLINCQLHGYIANTVTSNDGYPVSFQRHLTSIATFSKAQYAQVMRACVIIQNDLEAANIPIVLLKGAAYILANKKNARGRLISDIDILVNKEHLPNIEKLLSQKGWQAKELDDYDEKYYREWSHELPPYTHMETGVTLDIHHNLIPGTSGKTIDTSDIFATKVATEIGLWVPKDEYLILHSAIHLLLNDDIEKGLRDCLDLHQLISEYVIQNHIERLKGVFINSACEHEFYILINLLHQLFGANSYAYTQQLINEQAAVNMRNRAKDFAKAVFPNSPYLADSSNNIARFKVYINGHLSKMPLSLFIKHTLYKSYRMIVKKLLGEYIFKKDKHIN